MIMFTKPDSIEMSIEPIIMRHERRLRMLLLSSNALDLVSISCYLTAVQLLQH